MAKNTEKGNTGDWNTGYRNTGDWNTGYRNTGHSNTGHRNTGNWNTGYRNTGDSNTGHRNTGYRNTGSSNTGNWNTGNWNTVNYETGFFNTEQSDKVRVFNTEMNRDDWEACDKPSFIYFNLTEWVTEDNMTDQEKIDNETFHTTGGYLKSYEYKEAFRKSWDEADLGDRKKVLSLPNFDNAVFLEISGIDAEKELNEKSSCAGKVVEIDGRKYKLEEI